MAEKVDNKLVSNGVYSILADTWLKEPEAAEIPEIDQAEIDKALKPWEDRYNNIMAKVDGKNDTEEPAPDDVVAQSEVEQSVKADKPQDSKATKIISDQIRGEWEAISNYQQAIAELEESNYDFEHTINLLNDISDEEVTHVGELTQALSDIRDNLDVELDKGRDEAEEKLANSIPTEQLTEEVHTELTDEIDSFLDDVYKLRQEGLNKDGEYSISNLVFKELRNNGYLDQLKELKNELVSKELSLESLQEDVADMAALVSRMTKGYTKPNGFIACNRGQQATDVETLLKKKYPTVIVGKGKGGKAMVTYSKTKNEALEEDTIKQDGKWINKGNDGTHGKFKTKKAADAQRKAMFANGYSVHEQLDERTRLKYAEELRRITHGNAIVQPNGNFDIHNVKENEVAGIMNQIRQLHGVKWVQSSAGRFDFSHPALPGRLPARYYQIYGQLK